MLDGKVFVFKLISVDGFTTTSVKVGKISALDHEGRNDTVKDGSLVMQGLSLLAHTLFTGAKGSKVFGRLGHRLAKETEHNASTLAVFNFHVEKDLAGDLFEVPVDV